MSALTLFLADDDATAKLGAVLAEILRPGDLVSLSGDLGAGKTALARAVVRALTGDMQLDVPSPSFALVQPYEAGERQIIHADLYRLSDAMEIEELGLLDEAESIVLVEWAERAPELAAQATLHVALSLGAGGNGRRADIESTETERLAAIAAGAAEQGLPEADS